MNKPAKVPEDKTADIQKLWNHLAICKKHGLREVTISTEDFEVLLSRSELLVKLLES